MFLEGARQMKAAGILRNLFALNKAYNQQQQAHVSLTLVLQ